MDRIKKLKIKKQDGTFSDYIPIGADAENIDTTDGESVQLKLNKKPYYYDNVADMKADNKLKVGDMAITLGYYEANDGGGAEYKIKTSSENYYEELNNELIAELIIEEKINIKQLGAKENTDISTILNSALVSYRTIIIPNGTFKINNTVYIKANRELNLSIGTILNIDKNLERGFSLDKKSVFDGHGGYLKTTYEFTGSIIYIKTAEDILADIQPYTNNKNDALPQLRRYIKNLTIQKFSEKSINHPAVSTDIGATAIQFDIQTNPCWGLTIENVNIEGGFEYGIKGEMIGSTWAHDTILKDIFIQYPKHNVYLTRINNVYMYNLVIQPDKLSQYYENTPYVKTGLFLDRCSNINLENDMLWDWQVADNTDPTQAMITLLGICKNIKITTEVPQYNLFGSSSQTNKYLYYDNLLTVNTLEIKDHKGTTIDPHMAFYKNKRITEHYNYNQSNITGHDYKNFLRYDIPISLRNPYSDPNSFYQVGYFYFAKGENEVSGFNDEFWEQVITIEENGKYGIRGYSNLVLTIGTSSPYAIAEASNYQTKFKDTYSFPDYYYTYDAETKKCTIYKLISDPSQQQRSYQASCHILNSRRFIFDWKYIQQGALEDAILLTAK